MATGLFESLTVRIGADLTGYRAGLGRAVGLARTTSAKIGAGFAKIRNGLTTTATRAAATIGIVSAASLASFTQYETGLAEIATLVDDGTTAIERMGEEQRALAREFGTDIGDQLRGTYDAISGSVTDVAHATEQMRVVNKAAAAGITDTAVAGEGILRVMRAYAKEGVNATQASDFLFTIVRKGVTTFRELAPQIGRVAGLAANANLPMQELGAAFATITGTAKTEEATTQLTALLNGIIGAGSEASKTANKLGIDLSATALATKGLSGVIGEIQNRLGVVVDQEFARYIQTTTDAGAVTNLLAQKTGKQVEMLRKLFPNIRALRGALALMTNDGKVFTSNLDAMAKSTGATDVAFGKLKGTTRFTLNQLRAETKDLGITIGSFLLKPFLELVRRGRAVVDFIRRWAEENPRLSSTLAKIAIVVTAVGAAMIPVGLAISGIVGLFGVLSGVATVLAAVISGVAAAGAALLIPLGVIGALVASVVVAFVDASGGITQAWGRVKTFVIDKATAIRAWFVSNWPAIREIAVSVFEKIWAFVKPIMVAIGTFIIDSGKDVVEWFRENWPEIKETFIVIWEGVKAWWDTIGSKLWETIKTVVVLAWEAITTIVKAAGKAFGGTIKIIMGVLQGDWELAWSGMTDIVEAAGDLITGLWDASLNAIKRLFNVFVGPLTSLWRSFWDGIKEVVEVITDAIVTAVRSMWETISGIFDSIFGAFQSIGDFLSGGGSSGGSSRGERRHQGGLVHGQGEQPITALGGEFVMDPRTTSAFGPSFFRMLQQLAAGGAPSVNQDFHGGITIEVQGGGRSATEIADEIAERLDRLTSKGQRSLFRRGDR